MWSRLIRPDIAVVVTLACNAITLGYAAAEPYSALIVVLLPAAMVLAGMGCTMSQTSADGVQWQEPAPSSG